ncbi:hypothetical protein QLS91_06395 [Flavobacterium sp. LB2P84]|uniref:hypothetical protein n=1 Tax=Flavobacterium yafengii TaxID=3041253 RepID=UPI0024A99D92|nr:hypothetical protein [Flavobacterium yafengii]MDI6032699.1 hypothetical protein [Flavobacterium yafengii]
MKNQKINHILLWAIAIVLGFVMNSCSAKKTAKTETSEEIKTETVAETDIKKKEEETVNVAEKTTVDDKTKTKTTETSYKPIDPTKEASVTTPDGKKHQLNNAEILIKEIEEDKDVKTDNSRNSDATNKSELSDQSKSASKTGTKKANEAINIDRKAWSSLNMLWLLIPLGLLLAWLNKSKIITWAKNIWWI